MSFYQFLELDLVNINMSAKFYQNILNGLRVKFHFFFSEFEPRQNLDQSQMSFDYLMGYIMSVSMCKQNFITIIHSVQEIWPFSLFQNLELDKASTDENVSSQFLGLDLVNINIYAKVYQIIPSVQEIGPFSLFQNLALGKTSTDDKCLFAIPWARSFQHQIVCKILPKIFQTV